MEIGLFGINMGPLSNPDDSIAVAQAAEEAGFESLWTGEHVVLPEPQSPPSPLPSHYPMLDPNVSISWLAGQTSTIKFGTGIIILPQRNPLVLAKEMASLDVLSKGRLLFGVGIGYLKAEFDALGVPFDDKPGRTIEYLESMHTIWASDLAGYQGKYVNFSNVAAYPLPHQKPGPPVHFGGHVRGAYRRTISHGKGWYGFGLEVEQASDCIQELKSVSTEMDRPNELGPIEISVTPKGNINLERAKQYADLGVQRLIVLFPTTSEGELFAKNITTESIVDYVKKLGDEVVGKI